MNDESEFLQKEVQRTKNQKKIKIYKNKIERN